MEPTLVVYLSGSTSGVKGRFQSTCRRSEMCTNQPIQIKHACTTASWCRRFVSNQTKYVFRQLLQWRERGVVASFVDCGGACSDGSRQPWATAVGSEASRRQPQGSDARAGVRAPNRFWRQIERALHPLLLVLRPGFTLPMVKRFPPTSGIGKPTVNCRKPLKTAQNTNSNSKNQ